MDFEGSGPDLDKCTSSMRSCRQTWKLHSDYWILSEYTQPNWYIQMKV